MSWSWFWMLIFAWSGFDFGNFSVAENHKFPPNSAVVIGTVYCNICSGHDLLNAGHPISGASVQVVCGKGGNSGLTFREEVSTKKNGGFEVHLPPAISKKIQACSVKLISSNEPNCSVAANAVPWPSLRLASRKGQLIFSAGLLTFKPMQEPEICSHIPSTKNLDSLKDEKTSIFNPNDPAFLPPIQDPTPPVQPIIGLYLPPLPLLPRLPPIVLPRLPPQSGIPFPPMSDRKASVKPSKTLDGKGK